MSHEPTGYHGPIDLAQQRKARAKRRVRAGGRVPSDFMPIDYAEDPADTSVEGGGMPWWALVIVGVLAFISIALLVSGVYLNFFHR